MARVIKFRGKDIETVEWVYGDLIQRMGYMPSIMFPYENNGKVRYGEDAVKRETIGQFTGLHDKNGKEIYEGDIIFSKKGDGRAILHKIDYNEDNAMFVARPIQGVDFDYCHIRRDWIDKYSKEVIGNVYDNPELLNNK